MCRPEILRSLESSFCAGAYEGNLIHWIRPVKARPCDEELLSIATAEARIFVTFDVKDFPVIARRWAEAGRPHAGCAIVVGIDHGEFGAILETIAATLTTRPNHADWNELTLFLARALR